MKYNYGGHTPDNEMAKPLVDEKRQQLAAELGGMLGLHESAMRAAGPSEEMKRDIYYPGMALWAVPTDKGVKRVMALDAWEADRRVVAKGFEVTGKITLADPLDGYPADHAGYKRLLNDLHAMTEAGRVEADPPIEPDPFEPE